MLGRKDKGRITTTIIQLWYWKLEGVPWVLFRAEHVHIYKATGIASCNFSRLGEPIIPVQFCFFAVWLYFSPVCLYFDPVAPKPKNPKP